MNLPKRRSGCSAIGALLLCLAVLVLAGGAQAAQAITKSPLSILYVGVNPSKPLVEDEPILNSNPERAEELQRARTGDWAQFLKQYFQSVKVVYGEEYKEAMSSEYDVTIFDALPPLLRNVNVVNPKTGERVDTRSEYLSKNYRAATIMIGAVAAEIGEGRQLKIDWLCQCLGGRALGMKRDHPIFNRPYKVEIRYEQVKTPDVYKTFYAGRNLGPTMPMWRVQTESYRDGRGFPVGLVSTGYGFDNGIDAEWISGGHSDKGVDATAIGRHANFLLWGFAASPSYMTKSARLVFVNAVDYIARFRGARQITHKLKNVVPRADLREQQWTFSAEGAARYVALLDKFRKQDAERRRRALAKERAGKPLDEDDKMLVSSPQEPPVSREQIISQQPDALQKRFGHDFAAYENYYAENMDYFFSPAGRDDAVDVDLDAKALGIANNNVRLLDTAVEMLQKGDRVKMAKRILLRYTQESFDDAGAWAAWLERNRDRLYFSEGYGYKWIVIPEKSAAWRKENCDRLYFSECNGYRASFVPEKTN